MSSSASKVKRSVRQLLNFAGYKLSRIAPSETVEHHISETFPVILSERMRAGGEFHFIQIGGYDGVSGDSIHDFVKRYKWRGVICEPQSDSFRKLKETYQSSPNVSLENVAIAAERGERTLYFIRRTDRDLPDWIYQISSFDLDLIRNQVAEFEGVADLIDSQRVESVTPSDLIDKYRFPKLDLLQIDTEGYDYEILKLIDFRKLAPAIIRFEHAHLSRDQKADSCRLLIGEGYQLIFERADTIAYANEGYLAGTSTNH